MQLHGATRLLGVGVVVTAIALALMEATTALTRPLPMSPITPFSLPAFEVDVPLVPPFEELDSADAFDRWLAEILASLVAAVLVVVYYLTLALFAAGLAAIGVGIYATLTDEEPLRRRVARASRERTVQVAVVATILLWTVILNPWLIPLLAEVVIVLVVGGTVFAASVGGLLAVYDHRTPARTVLVMYPLGLGAVVLSLVAAGLASPAFNAHLRAGSTVLAIWLLDNVLAVGGLNEFLRRQFTLAGIGYFLMWLAIDVVVGWLIGALVLLVERTTGWTPRVSLERPW